MTGILQFLRAQNDFFGFLCGFGFFVQFVFALYARFLRQTTHAWGWLAGGALAACLNEWLQLPMVPVPDTPARAVLSLALQVCFFIGVLQFSMAAPEMPRFPRLPRWLPWLLLIPTAVAVSRNLPLAPPVAILSFGVPVLLLLAMTFRRINFPRLSAAETTPDMKHAPYGFAAIAVMLAVLAVGELFLLLDGHPTRLSLPLLNQTVSPLLMLAVCYSAIGMWLIMRRIPRLAPLGGSASSPAHPHLLGIRGRYWFSLVIAIVVCGWSITNATDEGHLHRFIGISLTFGVGIALLAAFLLLHNYSETTELLRLGERKFETIFESINDAITIHDIATGDIVAANRRAYEMVGLDADKAGRDGGPAFTPFTAHEPPYDSEHADAWIRKAAAGEPQVFEWLARDCKGRTFWVEVNLRKITLGQRNRLLSVVRLIDLRKKAQAELLRAKENLEIHVQERTAELAKVNEALQADIAARVKIETELRDSEARFRAVTENITAGILIFQDMHFIYANPGAEHITGYSRNDLLQMSFWSIVHPEFREMVKERGIAKQRGEPAPSQFAVKIVMRTGQLRWIFTSLGTISYGGRTAAMMTFFDITEQRKLEEERQAMSTRTQHIRKLESLGSMAGGIAHDFNNLLMAVMGNTDLLLLEHPENSTLRDRLEEIQAAARRAAGIADKMLAYSGRGIFFRESVNVNKFLAGMRPFLANFASNQVDITFDIQENLPAVRADQNQIRQMIVNLVTNAAEAIGEKSGHITISAGAKAFAREELDRMSLGGILSPGKFVFIQIADNGSGMDAETCEKMFDPFFSTKFIGRGMGMPALLGMVRNHGGAIDVASIPGSGTQIRLLFPISATSPEAATTRVEEEATETEQPERQAVVTETTMSEPQRAILVIDDEEALLKVVQTVLQAAGFHVLTAPDGPRGLGLFMQAPENIAAVILDLSMPGMSGEQVLQELHRIRPSTPVILTSGYSEQEATNGIAPTELAGFIKKPYRLDLLAKKIRTVLESTSVRSGQG